MRYQFFSSTYNLTVKYLLILINSLYALNIWVMTSVNYGKMLPWQWHADIMAMNQLKNYF